MAQVDADGWRVVGCTVRLSDEGDLKAVCVLYRGPLGVVRGLPGCISMCASDANSDDDEEEGKIHP